MRDIIIVILILITMYCITIFIPKRKKSYDREINKLKKERRKWEK